MSLILLSKSPEFITCEGLIVPNSGVRKKEREGGTEERIIIKNTGYHSKYAAQIFPIQL